MLHLEDSIHIYADSLNTELHSAERFMYSTISRRLFAELNTTFDFTGLRKSKKSADYSNGVPVPDG